MTEPLFTIGQLRELCKGDVSLLPVFVVHDDEYWTGPATVDSVGRIHMGERQFKATAAPFWPFKAPERIGAVSVLMRLDLQPHHLEGSDLRTGQVRRDQREFRQLAGQDRSGKRSDDE